MNVLKLFQLFSKWPLGKKIFSWLFCLKAPYFGSIKPRFETIESGRCIVKMKKRRAILNHLGTVHAIAMCNLAEAAGGLCLEATLDRSRRWIPKGMRVEYLKKATSDLTAYCEFDPAGLSLGENEIEVNVFDRAGEKVFRAFITMYVSERK